MKHFRKIQDYIDVQPLLTQLSEHPELWNQSDQWTASKKNCVLNDLDNIILRYNKSPDWNKPAFETLSAAKKIIFDLMRAIPGVMLGKVVISRLRPGKQIDPHIDRMPPGIPPYFQRYQIPLSVKKGVLFHVADESLFMQPGSSYWFDNQITHFVTNDSDEDRISMLTDIRPFDMD